MRKEKRRGAAVVEFALVVPVFILLVFGMIEFGRAIMVQQVLVNASREGARQAVLDGTTVADIESQINITGRRGPFFPGELMKNKMFSLDIETLGLRDETPIIQIGIAFFDINDDPGEMVGSMEFLVDNGRVLNDVEPYAAAMNQKILAALSGFKVDDSIECPVVKVNLAAKYLGDWVNTLTFAVNKGQYEDKIVFCGKNFSSFDRPKLERLPNWKSGVPNYHHRSPDPGSMWWRPEEDGAELPSTEVCMERAGTGGTVAHTAEQDAIVVATLIQIWTQDQRP